jgi:hypothetical protein
MSGASNTGWDFKPLHNVNSNYVNVSSENNPRFFGSNEISGGAKRLKRKIKNITRKYKMGSKKSAKRMKSRIKARYIGRTRTRYGGKKRRNTHKNKQRGGNYSQFMNNLPSTPSYSLGSLLSSAASGLASPPPFNQLPNCTNCIDNYNHYTKMGTSSL